MSDLCTAYWHARAERLAAAKARSFPTLAAQVQKEAERGVTEDRCPVPVDDDDDMCSSAEDSADEPAAAVDGEAFTDEPSLETLDDFGVQ